MLVALHLALLFAAPLDDARAALARGNLDAVLFALQPREAVGAAEAPAAAQLLVEAARLAAARGDALLSLQLAQMGLRRDAKNAAALELLALRSLHDKEFDLGIEYGQRWVAVRPGDARAAAVLARARELRASWRPVEIVRGRKRSAAGRQWPQVAAPAEQAARSVSAGRVVLYGTNWCGVCSQARAWLRAQGVAFEDRDIESEPLAAQELREKERAAGQAHRGVPVIEVDGKLLPPGFSAALVAQRLRAGG